MDVSICITTYNHEKYISECLLSVLNQDFDGSFEIIVCNDNSPDATEKVIFDVKESHPKGNCIRYYNNTPNLGYVKNTLHSFTLAEGKYVAVLDGDDYFIDSKKLQKQFDFLEQNSNFTAIGGDSLVIYEDTDQPNHLFSRHINRELSHDDLTDIKIMQTSTLFFRKDILKPDFPADILSADRCLYLLAGCYGKIKILPEALSSYRQFAASLSKNVTYETMKKDFAIIPFILKYGKQYQPSSLKTYFYYTLMAYSKSITLKQFNSAARGYLINNTLSKFSFNPLKLYHILKWGIHTVKQKYHLKKQNNSFV
ncbi:glycosyltransferase family 2 protein [Chryseobacterium gwangjuense]|uniref:glycosyltransferase family 2 protein n=1 Tax=Chryseobacterium gwangjuense TaxID=1069980 RepID=UPI001E5FCFBE|nr:glycosyltransferase [Chryseobacterium gwangjuense]MCE3075436.1 glycosyltransferase [Chryseobacterium gwangjuense]